MALTKTKTGKLIDRTGIGGAPRKWKNPEEVQKLIDEYFNVTPSKELTVTGLALHLDTSRETLIDYQKRDEFSDTIRKAKMRIANEYEKDLRAKGRSGDIFALKNFGWKDRQEIDQTTTVNLVKNYAIIEASPRKQIDDAEENQEVS